MPDCSRSPVPIAVLLVLAAALAVVPDPTACRQAACATVPTFEAIPLPELAGGSRVSGGCGNWQAGIVLSGQTRETAGPWKACVWSYSHDGWWYLSPLTSLDATRPSGAHSAGIAPSDTDTVIVAVGFSYNPQNRMKPIVWRKSLNDTSWTATPLPTLEGQEGAVLSILGEEGDDILGEEADEFVGWSSALGQVEKAVLWSSDGVGGWTVRMLPHYAPNLPGRALDGFVPQPGDTFTCGWAENSEGDTTAVVWQKGTGPWIRTALPLLPGGTQGMANSILGEEVDDLVGWSENAIGEHRGVRWYYLGGWQVEELGQLVGYSQSAGILGKEPNDIYAVGRSWDPGTSRATLWRLTDEEGHEFSDLNDLVTSGGVPPLTDAAAIVIDTLANVMMIAVNSVETPPGGNSLFAPGDPHAYVLEGQVPTGVDPEPLVPKRFVLYQNVPNPFNPMTTISFTLPKRTAARLSIYNVDGRLVTTLLDDVLEEGYKEVTWDGKDSRGNSVSSGLYFYRLTAGDRTLTKKMVLLK